MLNYLTKQLYNRRKRKAVSPVISTIIIEAIAIAISIAVALYLTGITSTFTKYERLDVTSAYANPIVGGTSSVELSVKNSGTSIASVDRILLNGKPTDFPIGSNQAKWNDVDTTISGNSSPITLQQGDYGTLKLPVPGISGQSIEITLHTVSGKEYPKVVVLP